MLLFAIDDVDDCTTSRTKMNKTIIFIMMEFLFFFVLVLFVVERLKYTNTYELWVSCKPLLSFCRPPSKKQNNNNKKSHYTHNKLLDPFIEKTKKTASKPINHLTNEAEEKMKPKKRSRSSLDSTTSRRSTRVSRASTTPSTSSRRRSGGSTNRSTLIANFLSDKECRKWTQVLRPPRPGVGFKSMVWVPVDELDDDERKVYSEQLEKRRKLNTPTINATTETTTTTTTTPATTATQDTGEENKAKESTDSSGLPSALVVSTPKAKVTFANPPTSQVAVKEEGVIENEDHEQKKHDTEIKQSTDSQTEQKNCYVQTMDNQIDETTNSVEANADNKNNVSVQKSENIDAQIEQKNSDAQTMDNQIDETTNYVEANTINGNDASVQKSENNNDTETTQNEIADTPMKDENEETRDDDQQQDPEGDPTTNDSSETKQNDDAQMKDKEDSNRNPPPSSSQEMNVENTNLIQNQDPKDDEANAITNVVDSDTTQQTTPT